MENNKLLMGLLTAGAIIAGGIGLFNVWRVMDDGALSTAPRSTPSIDQTDTSKALSILEQSIAQIDPNKTLVQSVELSSSGIGVVITVSNNWHIQNKQVRLQMAQNIGKMWAIAYQQSGGTKSTWVRFVDLNGNQVGTDNSVVD